MRVLSIFLVLVISLQSFSAEQIVRAYRKSDGQIVLDQKSYNQHFFSQTYDFENAFASNKQAQEYYERSVTYAHLGAALNWGALGAALTYLFISSGNNNYNSSIYWGIFLIPWVGGLIAANASQKNLTRAINIYNGVPESQAALEFKPQEKNSPGIAFSWEF